MTEAIGEVRKKNKADGVEMEDEISNELTPYDYNPLVGANFFNSMDAAPESHSEKLFQEITGKGGLVSSISYASEFPESEGSKVGTSPLLSANISNENIMASGNSGAVREPSRAEVAEDIQNLQNTIKGSVESIEKSLPKTSDDAEKSSLSTMKDMLYSLTIDSDGDGIPDFLDKDKDTATSKLSEDLYNIGAFMHEHTALWKKFEIQGLAGIIDMATKLIDAVARYAVAGKPPSEQGGDSSSGGNSGKEDEDNPFSSKKTGD